MIKHINYQNFLTTPFVAIKQQELYNIQNDDVVLIELNTPETPVALDYVNYNISGNPLNRDSNIALEQQEADLAVFEEGISGSGIFYPDVEEQNDNGTFKRLVYSQMNTSFYNLYRNPLQIFGMENIDFPLNKTDRYISEQFLMFSIPQNIMGDRLVEGSVEMYDNNLDDNVVIHDDSSGNLHAGPNLFSKIQELRPMGNILMTGSAATGCP